MKQWRWIASHRIASHGLHDIASHRMASHCIALHCIALDCIASHWIALHRIESHCMVWHRMASHGIASNGIASHRIASHRIASRRIVLQQWQQFGTGSAYRAGDAAMENGPATADGLGNQACDEDDEEACAVRTELEALVAHIQHQVFAPSGRTCKRADGPSVPRVCGSSTLGSGAHVAEVLGMLPVAGCDRERGIAFSNATCFTP